jgi:hypothetical protein
MAINTAKVHRRAVMHGRKVHGRVATHATGAFGICSALVLLERRRWRRYIGAFNRSFFLGRRGNTRATEKDNAKGKETQEGADRAHQYVSTRFANTE